MILLMNHKKMAINRRCPRDAQNEEEGERFVDQVSRAVRSNHLHKQSMIDIVVASIAIPLLVIFSLMLQNSMRRDWIHDFDTRWRILGLGLSLLFISLIVCLYVTHRLGFCIWAVHQRSELGRVAENRSRSPAGNSIPAPLTSTESQVHLMVNGELPPSYDSVMRNSDLPPSYFSVLVADKKIKNVTDFGDRVPQISNPVSPMQEPPDMHQQLSIG